MNAIDLLRAAALIGIPAGLVTGLLLGLVARRGDGWGGYASERRRAARLGHVALVMLPALGGLYATWLARAATHPWLAPSAIAWVVGAVALPCALFVVAWRPAWKGLLVPPALLTTVAAVGFACVGLS